MLRKIATLGLIQSVGIVINVIRSKVLAVLLGPAGFGVVATIDQLVLSAVQLSSFSIPFTALKFLSRSHSKSDDDFRRSYSAFFKVMLILALIAMFAALVVIPANLAQFDSALAAYRVPVTIALLGIPATIMLMFLTNALAARQQSTQSVLLTVASGAVILISGTIGCVVGGIDGIYLGIVPASTVLIIAVIVYLQRKMHLSAWAESPGVWSELFANSNVVTITLCIYAAVASSAVQLFVARFVALTHVSAEAAGHLHASLSIALSIGAVLGPATSLYFSSYVNRAIPAAEKMDVADRFLPRLVLLYCLGALPVLLFPELTLTLLFSEKFVPAGAILPWCVAWQCLYQVSNIYQQVLIGLDDAWGYGVVTAAGNVFAVVFCFLLIDVWGLLGIAAGFVGGALITALLTAIRLRTKHGLAVSASAPVLVIFAMFGFCTVAAMDHLTGELSLPGISVRLLTSIAFLAALWLALPATLRVELRTAIASRLRIKR